MHGIIIMIENYFCKNTPVNLNLEEQGYSHLMSNRRQGWWCQFRVIQKGDVGFQNNMLVMKSMEKLPFTSATTRHQSQKMWQKIVTTKCHYKMSLQIVTIDCYNKSEQNKQHFWYFYFHHGKWCKWTWNAIYLALMKVLDSVVTFLWPIEKYDNKVNTSCCHIFVAYRGEKCDDRSKYWSG